MKHHFCPSCEQRYGCPRGEANCGSPDVYDCLACYRARHRKQLEALIEAVEARFGFGDACAGFGDFCNAH